MLRCVDGRIVPDVSKDNIALIVGLVTLKMYIAVCRNVVCNARPLTPS